MIVRGGLDQPVDREIHPRRLGPGELAVAQVSLVHDLRDGSDAPVLEAEAPDEGLERAVLAVVAEVRAENIERDALARSVGGVGEGKLRVRVTEALDEPRRRDPVNVRPRAR